MMKRDVRSCPKCHTPRSYEQVRGGDGRPEFVCQCGHRWTCGKSGGIYTTVPKTKRVG